MSAVRRTVVTGANRGLGLEFVRQLAGAGDEVVATARRPEEAADLAEVVAASGGRVTVAALDASDAASVAAAAGQIGERFAAVDLLVNNAGIMRAAGFPDQATAGPLDALDGGAILEILRVNALGPVLVTQALQPLLAAAGRSVVVNLSSGMASIGNLASPMDYAYCTSKAALNMMSRHLAFDLRRQGTVVVAMSPGWVSTDMGGPAAPLEPQQSVKNMLAVVDGLTPADTARFLDHTGEDIPW